MSRICVHVFVSMCVSVKIKGYSSIWRLISFDDLGIQLTILLFSLPSVRNYWEIEIRDMEMKLKRSLSSVISWLCFVIFCFVLGHVFFLFLHSFRWIEDSLHLYYWLINFFVFFLFLFGLSCLRRKKKQQATACSPNLSHCLFL